jgi:hypothetical protein
LSLSFLNILLGSGMLLQRTLVFGTDSLVEAIVQLQILLEIGERALVF